MKWSDKAAMDVTVNDSWCAERTVNTFQLFIRRLGSRSLPQIIGLSMNNRETVLGPCKRKRLQPGETLGTDERQRRSDRSLDHAAPQLHAWGTEPFGNFSLIPQHLVRVALNGRPTMVPD